MSWQFRYFKKNKKKNNLHLNLHNAVSVFEFSFNANSISRIGDASGAGVLRVFAVLLAHSKAMWNWSTANCSFSSLTLCFVSWTLWVHATCATGGSAVKNLFDLALLHQFQMFHLSKAAMTWTESAFLPHGLQCTRCLKDISLSFLTAGGLIWLICLFFQK